MAQMVKNLPAIQICRRHKFDPWVRNIPWKGKWQPTPAFFPRESPWTEKPGRPQSMGLQESDSI